jgi:hypothetical protein
MSVTQYYYEQAAELLVSQGTDATTHSEPYWEGYLDAIAWNLAGQPTQNQHDYPYLPGSMKHDAWTYGWGDGQIFADQHAVAEPRKRSFWSKKPA